MNGDGTDAKAGGLYAISATADVHVPAATPRPRGTRRPPAAAGGTSQVELARHGADAVVAVGILAGALVVLAGLCRVGRFLAYIPWPVVELAFGVVSTRLLMLRPPGSGSSSMVRLLIVVPIVAYPWSKTIWMAFDRAFLEEADRSVSAAMVKLWASQPYRKLTFRYGYPDSERNIHLMITQPATAEPKK